MALRREVVGPARGQTWAARFLNFKEQLGGNFQQIPHLLSEHVHILTLFFLIFTNLLLMSDVSTLLSDLTPRPRRR